MTPVTKTFFPPIQEYYEQVRRIWNNGWLTNRGDLVKELEDKLREHLGIENIIITTNGTLSIQIALKVLDLKGEIITTPFSYVATTSAIVWENCSPVFVDIHPEYLTIDETKIEAAITPRTTGILATHVFGNPCNVELIEKIAEKHNIKVIYDAAHCFGVKYKGRSLFEFGDISTCSFHATKIFHTGEGGALFCKDATINHKLFYSHNFGHNGPVDYYGPGINAKISELQAAMGLTVLPYMNDILSGRKKVVDYYHQNLDFSQIRTIKIRNETQWNYSYYPVIFKTEEKLKSVMEKLNQNDIFPRRYFYPSLNTLNYVKSERMKNSEEIANSILCIPLYVGIDDVILKKIVTLINQGI